MSTARIGFIGVGMMGAGMAGRLLDAGHPLALLVNRNRESVERLCARGAPEAAEARALLAAATC